MGEWGPKSEVAAAILSLCRFVNLFPYLSACSFAYLSEYLLVFLSVCLSVHLSVCHIVRLYF